MDCDLANKFSAFIFDLFETCNIWRKVTKGFCWHQDFVPFVCPCLRAIHIDEIFCIKSEMKVIVMRFTWDDQRGKGFLLPPNFVPDGLSALGLYWSINQEKFCIKSNMRLILLRLTSNWQTLSVATKILPRWVICPCPETYVHIWNLEKLCIKSEMLCDSFEIYNKWLEWQTVSVIHIILSHRDYLC